MIRNLAFLSQVVPTAGKDAVPLTEKAEDVVIPAVTIEAAQFFQEAGAQRGVRINVTDPITQYRVKGHKDLLRQVFINIFNNGVKYSDENSEILVTPRPQHRTGYFFVEIESQGCKFDQSEREKIFELGYRSEAARAVRASGTGLGLFICRRILELAHSATIEAEVSAATGRTMFRLRFPSFDLGEPYVRKRDSQQRSHH
jgi:signal transduction histidine kinase